MEKQKQNVYSMNLPILMLQTLIILLSSILSSCGIYFDKEYYERISGIEFPAKYKVLETFDNGEFLTATAFNIDSLTLKKFIKENHFASPQTLTDLTSFSQSVFKKNKPIFTSTKNVYVLKRSKEKNHWNYIADLTQQKLWAEISYPDWAGN